MAGAVTAMAVHQISRTIKFRAKSTVGSDLFWANRSGAARHSIRMLITPEESRPTGFVTRVNTLSRVHAHTQA